MLDLIVPQVCAPQYLTPIQFVASHKNLVFLIPAMRNLRLLQLIKHGLGNYGCKVNSIAPTIIAQKKSYKKSKMGESSLAGKTGGRAVRKTLYPPGPDLWNVVTLLCLVRFWISNWRQPGNIARASLRAFKVGLILVSNPIPFLFIGALD